MMRLQNLRPPIRQLLTLLISMSLVGYAQNVPGFAEIRSPLAGDSLAASVTILGTADHPAFAGYELAFALDPNPADTWFPITERIETRVRDDLLGRWDVDGLAEGVYQIRLTVFVSSGAPLQAVVGGLVVGNPIPAPAATAEVASPTPDRLPAAEADIPERSQSSAVEEATESPEQLVSRLWRIGAGLGAGGLLALGLYAWLRPRLRSYLGTLRRRRMGRSSAPREQDP